MPPKKTPQKLPHAVRLALEAVEELKAQQVRLIDVRKLTPMTDYMLICTGTSNRHVASIVESVRVRAKHAGLAPRAAEGGAASEWVLVDLGEVIVHAMQVQARAHFQLEKLWDLPAPTASPKPKTTPKSKKKPAAAKRKPKKKMKKKR